MAGELDYIDDPRTRRDRYDAIKAKLWSDRASFDAHWRELADYMMPRRARFTTSDHNKGYKTNNNIIDSTGRYALRTLSSGLHAGLTSPARPWFKLTTPDPELAKFAPVKLWLHEVTGRINTVFSQTNLYNVLPIVYGDLGLFGTAAMSILEDTKDLFRAYAYACGTYAFGLDHRGLATTFVREYRMTVRQLIRQFAVREDRSIDWSKVSRTVKDLWDKGSYEVTLDVCHIVTPNELADPDRFGAKYFPWASCYYEKGSEATGKTTTFLRESGFNEFPFMCPRWDITDGDTYGTDCPGMTVLGDVKQLQTMQRRLGQAIAKMVDPPMVGPAMLRSQKVSVLPGEVTYADEREGMKGLRSIYDINLRLDHLAVDIERVQYRVQRGFYEDLFLMLARSDSRSGQPPTAREVEERHEEKLLALGPVLERTSDELLDPIIDRVFAMMLRAGMIPQAPEQLEGVDLKVEYTSIMAQAQKLVGVVGTDRFLQSALVLADAFPDVTQKVKSNEVVDHYADILGVPPDLIRSNEEADQRVAEIQQQQAAAAQAQQAKDLTQAVKNAGTTPMNEGSALDAIAGGVRAAAA